MKIGKHIFRKISAIDSMIALIGIFILLSAALFVQYFMHEAPCPMCLMQRAALVNIGICLIMNLRYGNHVSHWAMIILSACAGIAVSIRQILLHITSPIGFGSAVFGLHLYTWCFIVFSIAIAGSALVLLIYPEEHN